MAARGPALNPIAAAAPDQIPKFSCVTNSPVVAGDYDDGYITMRPEVAPAGTADPAPAPYVGLIKNSDGSIRETIRVNDCAYYNGLYGKIIGILYLKYANDDGTPCPPPKTDIPFTFIFRSIPKTVGRDNKYYDMLLSDFSPAIFKLIPKQYNLNAAGQIANFVDIPQDPLYNSINRFFANRDNLDFSQISYKVTPSEIDTVNDANGILIEKFNEITRLTGLISIIARDAEAPIPGLVSRAVGAIGTGAVAVGRGARLIAPAAPPLIPEANISTKKNNALKAINTTKLSFDSLITANIANSQITEALINPNKPIVGNVIVAAGVEGVAPPGLRAAPAAPPASPAERLAALLANYRTALEDFMQKYNFTLQLIEEWRLAAGAAPAAIEECDNCKKYTETLKEFNEQIDTIKNALNSALKYKTFATTIGGVVRGKLIDSTTNPSKPEVDYDETSVLSIVYKHYTLKTINIRDIDNDIKQLKLNLISKHRTFKPEVIFFPPDIEFQGINAVNFGDAPPAGNANMMLAEEPGNAVFAINNLLRAPKVKYVPEQPAKYVDDGNNPLLPTSNYNNANVFLNVKNICDVGRETYIVKQANARTKHATYIRKKESAQRLYESTRGTGEIAPDTYLRNQGAKIENNNDPDRYNPDVYCVLGLNLNYLTMSVEAIKKTLETLGLDTVRYQFDIKIKGGQNYIKNIFSWFPLFITLLFNKFCIGAILKVTGPGSEYHTISTLNNDSVLYMLNRAPDAAAAGPAPPPAYLLSPYELLRFMGSRNEIVDILFVFTPHIRRMYNISAVIPPYINIEAINTAIGRRTDESVKDNNASISDLIKYELKGHIKLVYDTLRENQKLKNYIEIGQNHFVEDFRGHTIDVASPPPSTLPTSIPAFQSPISSVDFSMTTPSRTIEPLITISNGAPTVTNPVAILNKAPFLDLSGWSIELNTLLEKIALTYGTATYNVLISFGKKKLEAMHEIAKAIFKFQPTIRGVESPLNTGQILLGLLGFVFVPNLSLLYAAYKAGRGGLEKLDEASAEIMRSNLTQAQKERQLVERVGKTVGIAGLTIGGLLGGLIIFGKLTRGGGGSRKRIHRRYKSKTRKYRTY